MARRGSSKSIDNDMQSSDHENGLSMSRAQGQVADDDAAAILKQQIIQLPQYRRSDRRVCCDPQRFVARSSRRRMTTDRFNESYDALAVHNNMSTTAPTTNNIMSEAAIKTKKSIPSKPSDCIQPADCLHKDDCATDKADEDDEVEFISCTPINDKQSNPLLIHSKIMTRNLPATTRRTKNSTHQLLNGSNKHNARRRTASRESAKNTNNWKKEEATNVINNDNLATPTSAMITNVDDRNSNSMCSQPLLHHDNALDFQVSSTSTKTPDGKYICRIIPCEKIAKKKDGFCCNHTNQFLISTGKCSWWECKCGNKNLESFKRCGECQKWRHGKIFPKNVTSIGSSIVLEEKRTRGIRKMVGGKTTGMTKEESCDADYAMDTSAASGKRSNEKILPTRKEAIVSSHTTTTTTTTSTVARSKAKAGIRSQQTFVPPDLVSQISTERHLNDQGRAYCKVLTCRKLDQTKMDGFCQLHFNMFALNGKENDLNMSSRVCQCGQLLMGGEAKQCSNCKQSKKKGRKSDKKSRDQKRRRLLLDEFSLDSFPSSKDDAAAAAATKTTNVGSSFFRYDYDNYAKDWCTDITKHPSNDGQNVVKYCATSAHNSDARVDEDHPHTIDAKPLAEVLNEDDDEFSFSDLEVQVSPPLENSLQRREIQLDRKMVTCSQTSHWRCLRCENLNTPQNSCCSTCRYQCEHGARTSPSELSLLERTRYELLNGRDFWICTDCVIAIPSITMPCGKCKQMISFVPLEMEEFEEFVRKQREKGSTKRCKSSVV